MYYCTYPLQPKPLWKFEGDWATQEKDLIEVVLQKHQYKHSEIVPSKSWLLVCRRFEQETDFHAGYGTKALLYDQTVEGLSHQIDRFYITGKTNSINSESDAR